MSVQFFHKSEDTAWSVADSELQLFHFPGGEPHFKGTDAPTQRAQIAVAHAADGNDLLALAVWADAVRQRGEELWLAMPYLPAARADRGTPFTAHVVADYINDQIRPDKLIALDPHSDVMPDLLRCLRVLDLPRIVAKAVEGVVYKGVIAPDKGARGRASSVAAALGVPLLTAGKTRDFETGKLTGFEMLDDIGDNGRYLIVDDICDGGGTFLGLAEVIHEQAPIELDLWVSHGIFSKGIEQLLESFEDIYTTDSWADVAKTFMPPRVHVTQLGAYLFGALNV